MTPPVTIDLTAGFAGEVLRPVPIDEAASRIRVYSTSQYSGWAVYTCWRQRAVGRHDDRGPSADSCCSPTR